MRTTNRGPAKTRYLCLSPARPVGAFGHVLITDEPGMLIIEPPCWEPSGSDRDIAGPRWRRHPPRVIRRAQNVLRITLADSPPPGRNESNPGGFAHAIGECRYALGWPRLNSVSFTGLRTPSLSSGLFGRRMSRFAWCLTH